MLGAPQRTGGPSLRRLVFGLVQLGSLPQDVAEDRLPRIRRRTRLTSPRSRDACYIGTGIPTLRGVACGTCLGAFEDVGVRDEVHRLEAGLNFVHLCIARANDGNRDTWRTTRDTACGKSTWVRA